MNRTKYKYDVGDGITLTDDGFTLRVEKKTDTSSSSIGIRRPVKIGPEVEILYSLGRDYFYVTGFLDMHGFWLGVETYPTIEELKSPTGIFGREYVQFTENDGSGSYYRAMMSFTGWDVKSEREYVKVPKTERMVEDYLIIQQGKDRESEQRFNDWLKEHGCSRTLADLIKKVPAYVEKPEPPIRKI